MAFLKFQLSERFNFLSREMGLLALWTQTQQNREN